MVSSLKRQLQNVSLGRLTKDSILFDKKAAQDVSLRQVYEIALTGFQDLKSVNSVFSLYEKQFFSPSALELDRFQLAKEECKELDAAIAEFLCVLSPFMSLKPAQKVLEWFIRRFRVHECNRDSVVCLVLPYYDSAKIFANVIATVKLDNTMWSFLEGVKKNRVPLDRGVFASQCIKDHRILKLVLELIPKQLRMAEKFPSFAVSKSLYSTVCAVIISIISPSMDESTLGCLLPYIFQGLDSQNREYQLFSLLIVGEIVANVTLSSTMVDALVQSIGKCSTLEVVSERCVCLAFMVKTHSVMELPGSIVKFPIASVLHVLKEYDVQEFGVLYMKTLLTFLGKPEFDCDVICTVIQAKILVSNSIFFISNYFIAKFLSCGGCSVARESILQPCQKIAQLLYHLYPKELEMAVRAATEKESFGDKLLFEFMSLYMCGAQSVVLSDSFSVLGLAIYHADETIRLSAVQKMKDLCTESMIEKDSKEFVCNALLARLRDSSAAVVSAVIQFGPALVRYVEPSDIVASFQNMLENHTADGVFTNILQFLPVLDPPFSLQLEFSVFPRVLRLLSQFVSHLPATKVNSIFYCCTLVDGTQFVTQIAKNLALKSHFLPENVRATLQVSDPTFAMKFFLWATSVSSALAETRAAVVFELSNIVQQFLMQSSSNRIMAILPSLETDPSICQDSSERSLLLEGIKCFLPHLQNSTPQCLEMSISLFHSFVDIHESDLIYLLFKFPWKGKEWIFLMRLLKTLPAHFPMVLGLVQAYLKGAKPALNELQYREMMGRLLLCLSSDDYDTRKTALACFTAISSSRCIHNDVVMEFIAKILTYKEEILLDHSRIHFVIEKHLEDTPSSHKQKVCHVFVSFVRDVALCSSEQLQLLSTFKNVSSKHFVLELLPLFGVLVDRIKPGYCHTKDAEFLKQLVGFISVKSVSSVKDPGVLKQFLYCLSLWDKDCSSMSICCVIIQQLRLGLFSVLPAKILQGVFAQLLDLLVEHGGTEMEEEIKKCLQSCILPIDVVAEEVKRRSISDMLCSGKAVVKKTKVDSAEMMDIVLKRVQYLSVLLEILLLKSSVENRWKICPTLFELISNVFEVELVARKEAQSYPSLEYLKQLCLSCLLMLFVDESDAVMITESIVNVECIVQCMRTSNNPQTQNSAVLLLSEIAKRFHDRVLHNILPIFTFMGAHMIRQDDAISFQIISKTVDSVLPAIVKNGKSSDTAPSVCNILKVFVDAFPHIPVHRRIPLFQHLCETLSTAEYLHVLLMLFVEKKCGMLDVQGSEEISLPSETTEFCIELLGQFPYLLQMDTICCVMKFVDKLQNLKSDDNGKFLVSNDLCVDVAKYNQKYMRFFKCEILTFLNKYFAALTVPESLYFSAENTTASAFQSKLASVLQDVLTFLSLMRKHFDGSHKMNASVKFEKICSSLCYDLLSHINRFLSISCFVSVVDQLLQHPEAVMKRRALLLLNAKVVQVKGCLTDQQELYFVQLLDTLIAIISSKDNSVDTIVNKQTALLSMEILCRQFACKHPVRFLQTLPCLFHPLVLRHKNVQVVATSLICISSFVNELKVQTIPYFPQYFPIVLDVFSGSLHRADDEISSSLLQTSCLTVVESVLLHLSKFLSPYAKQMCLLLCSETTPFTGKDTGADVTGIMMTLRRKFAVVIPPRILMPALFSSYEIVVNRSEECIRHFFDILLSAIECMTMEDVSTYQLHLFKFFLVCFDLRRHSFVRTARKDVASMIENCEGHILESFAALVLKLPETSLRTMMLKCLSWSHEALVEYQGKLLPSIDRIILFYRLAGCLSNKLVNLFTLQFSLLLSDMCSILIQSQQKTLTDHIAAKESLYCSVEEKELKLLRYVMDCFRQYFLYDTEGSCRDDKKKFDNICSPLVDQVENTIGTAEEYRSRMSEYLIPAIGQFAKVCGSDALWRPLNYEILLKTRNSSPMVRFAALLSVQELFHVLGEEYLILLPETIPFLAELMEDDAVEVEQLCQQFISALEECLGEPLQKYF